MNQNSLLASAGLEDAGMPTHISNLTGDISEILYLATHPEEE